MAILVLTGNRLRHLHFTLGMIREFPKCRVMIEDFHEETGKNYTNMNVSPTMAEHFAAFDRTEQDFFAEEVEAGKATLKDHSIRHMAPGTINEPENVAAIKAENPEQILVYSTSILKDPILKLFPRRMINLHAGLSPYYRGAGTNFFPFYNRELEYVGMTVHYLDAGIDSGDIILQGRPTFMAGDDTHTIGCKCVDVGIDLMARVVRRRMSEGQDLPGRPQDLASGHLYLKKHFTDECIESVRRYLAEGLVQSFIAAPRDADIVRWS